MSEVRSERADTMLGAVLGSYRITGVLAAGGMGTVFKGKHEVLDRKVAIKLLRRELTGNDEIVQRFWAEARAATAIAHPGIIEVVDFGYSPEGRAYLVMELLDGESLAARLARGKLSEAEAIHITRDVATALVAAHGKTIVHRDLKPDNIYLVPSGAGVRTKILDFGIAKLQDGNSQTQTGALIGTPLYMAPEQARSAREIDHRADLYSLGCILYEMLAGQPPFVAPGAGELIAMHMFNDVPRLHELGVAVTPELDAIVMRLLEKEPDARFQNAQALIDALARSSGPERASGPLARPGASGQAEPAFTATAPKAIAPQADPRGGWNGDVKPTTMTATAASGSGRSMIPIIAGAVTVGLAILVVVLVLGRGDDTAAAAPPSAGSAAIVAPTAPPKPANTTPTAGSSVVAAPDRGSAHATGDHATGTHDTTTADKHGTKRDGKHGTTGKHGATTGPITTPGGPVTTPSGPVTTPGGPVTTPTTIHSPTGSPLETTVDDDQPKRPPPATPLTPSPSDPVAP